MDDLPSPTARELEILKVLWEHGPSAVSDVHRLFKTSDGKQPHLNTIQTLLRLMETKGLVAHTQSGRTFIYEPMFSREESASRFLDRVFDGAASQLLQCLLKAEAISNEELEQLRLLINKARKQAP